jgi:hypothetical protein
MISRNRSATADRERLVGELSRIEQFLHQLQQRLGIAPNLSTCFVGPAVRVYVDPRVADILRATVTGPGYPLQSACQKQDQQNEQNQPAKTTPNSRATEVESASAEQQQKNYQHNEQIHRSPSLGFRSWSL